MKVHAFFAALLVLLPCCAAQAAAPAPQYLAFQIFTGALDTGTHRLTPPPSPAVLGAEVEGLRSRIMASGTDTRKLGFIVGPLSFDATDDEVRALITNSFDIALQKDIAVGFHLDDSIFWGRMKNLDLPGNIEWRDWSGLPSTGRRLDWSSQPVKVMPQLCLNAKGVTDAVTARGRVIGHAIERGLRKLHFAHKDELFMGVIAGWETQMGRDYKSGAKLGYCAFTNKGYSAQRPPADEDAAREEVLSDFIALWSQSLAQGGVPEDKIYSHIAFTSKAGFEIEQRLNPARGAQSYLEATHATPPEAAFGAAHAPGFSTYPEPGHLEQIADALKKHGDPPWISAAGTALAPPYAGQPAHATDMEEYLSNLFGSGARIVNIFGWGMGSPGNMLRQVAESDTSIAAYRKFLRGAPLKEHPLPPPQIPSPAWSEKMQRIRSAMPGYVAHHGIGSVQPLMQRLNAEQKAQEYASAEKTADQILAIIGR